MSAIEKATIEALRRLPYGDAGDRLVYLAYFRRAHRRWPRHSSGLFNDYLYFLKSSENMYSCLRQLVSNKQLVKMYYRDKLAQDLAPRTYFEADSAAGVFSSQLVGPCILKPTHLSGGIILEPGRSGLTREEKQRVQEWFNQSLYADKARERNYRFQRATVIGEELVEIGSVARDYKIFCWNGAPRIIQVVSGKTARLYRPDWTPLYMTYSKENSALEPRPRLLDEALNAAAILSAPFEFVRVDFYLRSDRIYIGEMTSVPNNAHGRFDSLVSERRFMTILRNG